MVDQQDTPTMINTELAVMSNPTSQALEQKEEDSKRETVDEEWLGDSAYTDPPYLNQKRKGKCFLFHSTSGFL